jgi:hypothetical protein
MFKLHPLWLSEWPSGLGQNPMHAGSIVDTRAVAWKNKHQKKSGQTM